MELPELLKFLNSEFDDLCQARHDMGAEKYGPVNFLRIDSMEMAIEEVLDLSNYARYTYIKLRMLQEYVKEVATAVGEDINVHDVLGKEGFMSNKIGGE